MPQRSGHRHPTMPITKCDSKELSEFMRSRESLVALQEGGTENNNKKTITSPLASKLHRSDSYKAATNRLNRISMLDSEQHFRRTAYEKEKYKSLPVTKVVKPRTKKGENLKRPSDNDIKRNKVKRQESGAVPSPDTDDDQMSVVSERKKKSRFQKAKERILHSFQKQSKRDNEHLLKRKEQEKRKKLKDNRNKGNGVKITSAEFIPSILEHGDRVGSVPNDQTVVLDKGRQYGNHQDTGIYRKGQTSKVSDSERPATWAFKEDKVGIEETSREVRRPSSSVPASTHEYKESINEIFEKLLKSDLHHLDRGSRSSRKVHSDTDYDFARSGRSRGDRSGLSLNLRTHRPRSIKYAQRVETEKRSEEEKCGVDGQLKERRSYSRQVSTYSDLDIDGHEDNEGRQKRTSRDLKSPDLDRGEFDNVPFDQLPTEEKDKRVNDVANRLKLIAKRCVSRIESESGSDLESPMREMRPGDFQLVEDIIAELRREGDRLSTQLDLQNNLTPVILQMAQQGTYNQFKSVVSTALRDSIGWDQIAMYYYLTKTAVHVAGASTSIATMAVDYFKERYSSWIADKGGWESVIEATTTDSELD